MRGETPKRPWTASALAGQIAETAPSSAPSGGTFSLKGEKDQVQRPLPAAQLGQKPCSATQGSVTDRAVWVGPLKTTAGSAKPSSQQ
jgi:hypothetical protein